jgi:DNA-binding response OmpR family regulator
MAKRILVGEETPEALNLRAQLKTMGSEVDVTDFSNLPHIATAEQYDVVLIVTDNRRTEFLAVLTALRSLPSYPPLLLIGPDCQLPAIAATALQCGCDGSLGVPVDLLLLDSWMDALIRRGRHSGSAQQSIVRAGVVEIDARSRTVRTPKTSSVLTERELELLLYLAKNQDRVCTRQELLEAIWNSNSPNLHATLNTHINRIRIKIEEDLKNPKYLLGIYGLGYRLMGAAENTPVFEDTGSAFLKSLVQK